MPVQAFATLGLRNKGFMAGLRSTQGATLAWAKKMAKQVPSIIASETISFGFSRMLEKMFPADQRSGGQKIADTFTDPGGLKRKFNRTLGTVTAGLAVIMAVGQRTTKRLKDLQDQTELSAEEIQVLEAAGRRGATSLDKMTTAVDNLGSARKEAAEGNEELRSTFAAFGVSLDDLQNPGMATIDLMERIGMAIDEGPLNPARRRDMRDLFGKGGERLVTAVREIQNGPGFAGLISEEEIKTFDKGTAKIEELYTAFRNIGTRMAAGLLSSGYSFGKRIGADKLLSRFEGMLAGPPPAPKLGDDAFIGPKLERGPNLFVDKVAIEDESQLVQALNKEYEMGLELQDAKLSSSERQKRVLQQIQALLIQNDELTAPGGTVRDAAEAAQARIRILELQRDLINTSGTGFNPVRDSLAKIGGFTSRPDSPIASSQGRMERSLKQIERNTDPSNPANRLLG